MFRGWDKIIWNKTKQNQKTKKDQVHTEHIQKDFKLKVAIDHLYLYPFPPKASLKQSKIS